MALAIPLYVQRQLDLSVASLAPIRVLTIDIAVNAEEGSGGSGTITLDDPDGTLEPLPLKVVGIYDAAVSDANAKYIWVGYAHKRRYYRGENFAGPTSRSIDVELYDLNEVLSRRLVRAGDDGNRPAETSDERLAWIFATPLTSLVDDDTTYVDTSAVDMDAADYTGQSVMAVLEDIGEATGFNYFLTWTGATFTEDGVVSPWGKFTLVFCDPGSATFKSTVRLTNDPADIDNTTTFGVAEAQITHDPDEVYDGALLTFDGPGGSVYVNDPDTETAFALGGRDTTLPSVNVKSAAKATIRALRMLADFSHEEKRGSITWYMRPEDMHLIRAGHAIDVKFTHLPDLADDYVQVRLVDLHITQDQNDTNFGFYKCESEFTLSVETPVVPTEGSPILSARLEIGSDSYAPSHISHSGNSHYATEVGESLYTLVVGKQYRLVATIIDDFYSPLGGYDNMDGPGYSVVAGAASGTLVDAPGYGWTPGDGTGTSEGDYAGISFDYAPSHTPGAFGPGISFFGDWLTYDGPAVAVDIGIHGTAISGFYGFYWIVDLELQERDPP